MHRQQSSWLKGFESGIRGVHAAMLPPYVYGRLLAQGESDK
jgi:hypothetical protein